MGPINRDNVGFLHLIEVFADFVYAKNAKQRHLNQNLQQSNQISTRTAEQQHHTQNTILDLYDLQPHCIFASALASDSHKCAHTDMSAAMVITCCLHDNNGCEK